MPFNEDFLRYKTFFLDVSKNKIEDETEETIVTTHTLNPRVSAFYVYKKSQFEVLGILSSNQATCIIHIIKISPKQDLE